MGVLSVRLAIDALRVHRPMLVLRGLLVHQLTELLFGSNVVGYRFEIVAVFLDVTASGNLRLLEEVV
jgi:hypothetical protein